MTPTIIHTIITIALVILAVLLHRRERRRGRSNEVWPFYVGAVINIVAALGYIIHY